MYTILEDFVLKFIVFYEKSSGWLGPYWLGSVQIHDLWWRERNHPHQVREKSTNKRDITIDSPPFLAYNLILFLIEVKTQIQLELPERPSLGWRSLCSTWSTTPCWLASGSPASWSSSRSGSKQPNSKSYKINTIHTFPDSAIWSWRTKVAARLGAYWIEPRGEACAILDRLGLFLLFFHILLIFNRQW